MPDNDYDHEITISSDTGATVGYEIETTGALHAKSVTEEDDVGEKHAEGAVGPGNDVFVFNGDLIKFDVTQNAEAAAVELDGLKTDAELLGMHRVELRAGDARTHYEIASAGRIIRTADEPIDVIVGERIAKGTMGNNGTDVYRCEAGPTEIWANEDIDVVRNDGEPKTIAGTERGAKP